MLRSLDQNHMCRSQIRIQIYLIPNSILNIHCTMDAISQKLISQKLPGQELRGRKTFHFFCATFVGVTYVGGFKHHLNKRCFIMTSNTLSVRIKRQDRSKVNESLAKIYLFIYFSL